MTSNPMFNSRVAENAVLADDKPMTIQGTVNKTMILLLIVVAVGGYTWNLCATGFSDKAMLLTTVGLIAGFITALITTFKPNTANITSPIYALCEGLALGSISYAYASLYSGIVINAVMITLIALFSMLFLYKTKIIQATPTFRKVILVSTLACMIFYLAGFIGHLLGHPMTIFNGGLVGIGVSVLICAIAAFNFILDFDFIDKGSQGGLPSYFEWYGAFGLMVTLIWLYIEVLRLLAQLNRRN